MSPEKDSITFLGFQNVRKYLDSSQSQRKNGRNNSNSCFCIPKHLVDSFSGSAGGGGNFRSLMDQINLNESDVGSDDLNSALPI